MIAYKVLGLDLSTKTGIAVVDQHKTILYSSEVEFKKLTSWERIAAITTEVVKVIETYQPNLIVIEEGFIGQASSAIVLTQINAIVRYYLWQDDTKYLDVSAGVLKKWLTGTGAAQKDVMMMHVLKQFKHESKTNNIADAIALAMYGLCTLGIPFPATQTAICVAYEGTRGLPKVRKKPK